MCVSVMSSAMKMAKNFTHDTILNLYGRTIPKELAYGSDNQENTS